ncbi:MAG: ABC transporter substrate-binding protein [Chloroflexota bacterium]|nr:ABC transporter substrate-binding protein [Chloroflexota bacterium]
MKGLMRILTGLTLLFVLAACIPSAAPAGDAPAAAEGEAAAQGGEAVTLRVATIFDATGMEQWQPVFDEYMQANPNIKVEVESTAGSGAAIYPDVLKTSMASGSPPDVFFMWGGTVAGPFIDADQVLDLEAYYDQYGWKEQFAPWVFDRITRNGKLYGVPFHALGMGFWYNKDVLAQYNLEIPTTFAEQEAMCATLKENDVYCVTIGGKFGWHTMRVLDYFLEVTCGPETHNKLNALEESWENPCVTEAYSTFQKWVDNGWVVPDFLSVEPNDARLPWYQGDAALILEGVWYDGVLKNDEQDRTKYDFYLPPTDQEPLRFSTFPEQWMISKGSQHPDEAAAFINFISQADLQTKYPDVFVNSATIGVNPDCAEWALTCKWRDLILSAPDTYPPTDQAFEKELMDGFFEVQDGIVAKKYTPEEGAALMQQRVDEWKAKQ